MAYLALIIIIIVLFVFVIPILYIKKYLDYKKIYNKFKDVVDIDSEVEKTTKEFEELKKNTTKESEELKKKYASNREIYKKLMEELAILNSDMEMVEFGFYKPHFDFDTSEQYKEEIKNVRGKQKELIKNKSAIECFTEWKIEGSRAAGKASENQYMRLMLRAFNNECDASILKVKWNNVSTMETRIEKAFEVINKLGTRMNIFIQDIYLESKLEELRLAHEYQEKKYEEKEEQREIREQMREEEKLIKEIEKAKKDAARDEAALEKARNELEQAHGEESSKLKEQIAKLEQALKD